MNKKKLKLRQEFYDRVYTILVDQGAAVKTMRDPFINYHMDETCLYHEWRFSGMFGFGGKYRKANNAVDYYLEDRTKDLDKRMKKINDELKELKKSYKGAF